MHLQMQRDVWLDNVINFRPYIRRYASPNEDFECSYPPNDAIEMAFHGWANSGPLLYV